MKKCFLWLLLFVCLVVVNVKPAYAVSNGEVLNGHQTFTYNVMLQDKITGLIFEGEWGLTPTLAFHPRYIYASPSHYLDLFLKFKLIEGKDLKAAGRVGLYSDFAASTKVEKTLGIIFTKDQNSFLETSIGLDYSLDYKRLGYFVGIDYKLTNHTYFQLGYEKFMGRTLNGLTLGIRTDL